MAPRFLGLHQCRPPAALHSDCGGKGPDTVLHPWELPNKGMCKCQVQPCCHLWKTTAMGVGGLLSTGLGCGEAGKEQGVDMWGQG